jgi:hypothetical protein
LASLTASLGDSFILLVFNLNQQYIAENLCEQKEIENNTCQGCCQLKKQMEQQNEQDKTNPNQTKRKLLIDFFSKSNTLHRNINTSKTISYCLRLDIELQTFYSDIFHPPKV